ncbi:hypothetical protein ACRWQN_05845 [Shewanella sp. HL-SH8]|uniref:hypothetical protein n=1 Tax=Shewanella sp. HL-SH8 TaxID=3436242 RepID=UPI003EBDF78F
MINKNKGGKFSQEGLRSAWKRPMLKMEQEYVSIERIFTVHDIKAKRISDFDRTLAEEQQYSGHMTMAK